MAVDMTDETIAQYMERIEKMSIKEIQKEIDMKKILIIEDCVHCPYFKRIVIDRKLKDVCLGRNKVAYLANEVESSISKDCPLETAKEESK